MVISSQYEMTMHENPESTRFIILTKWADNPVPVKSSQYHRGNWKDEDILWKKNEGVAGLRLFEFQHDFRDKNH